MARCTERNFDSACASAVFLLPLSRNWCFSLSFVLSDPHFNRRRTMSKKVPYDVSGSSLVNLKAELFRKQEESRRKGENKSSGSAQQGYVAVVNNSLKSKIKSKSKSGKESAEGTKKSAEETKSSPEDFRSWETAKAKLAAKAKIYDEMQSGQYIPLEGEDEHLLVDFSRKAETNRQFEQRKASRNSSSSDDDSDTDMTTRPHIPLPQSAGDEWTEYEDYLGRSRKCLRKDLPSLMAQNEKLKIETARPSEAEKPLVSSLPLDPSDPSDPSNSSYSVNGPVAGSGFDFGQSPLEERTLMSADMRREVERRLWEEEEVSEASVTKGKVPIHYQTVENNEIRNLGVGYFKFSKEEDVRNEEIEALKNLHQQTVTQRTQKEEVKAKRKAVLDARLAKLRQRKMLKGETVPDLPKDDSDDEFEKILAAKAAPPSFVEDLTPAVRGEPAQLRPWDEGKCVDPDFQDKTYTANRREERNFDFAPPSSYSANSKKPNQKQNQPTSSSYTQKDGESGYGLAEPWKSFSPNQPTSSSYTQKDAESGQVSAEPWKNMQPWKERMKKNNNEEEEEEEEKNKVFFAEHLEQKDEKRPWAFAPPPKMYTEEGSAVQQMFFSRISEEEIKEQAKKLFAKTQTDFRFSK